MLRLALIVLAASALYASDVPEQVHINQGNSDGTAMTVSWITSSTTSGTVQYGTTPSLGSSVDQKDAATSYSFRSAYSSDTYTSGLIHHVTITSLEHNTRYYYQCGTTSDGMSTTFSFVTPPPVGPNNQSFVLNLIGDLGQTKDSLSTITHVSQDSTAHMTLLVGDLSYADSANKPSIAHPCTQTRWDSWGRMVEFVFANQSLMVLPGNHEVEQEGPAPATQTPFLAFQNRFKMPFEDSNAPDGSLYYSFNAGPAHIIMLNSYMDFSEGSNQYKWLVEDLQAVDRTKTPWLIANMHAPWYNSDVHHHDEPEEVGMRTTLEPLFHSSAVDLVFAGHVHAYERMFPTYNNVSTPGATTYINIGDGGNREGPATGYYPQPSWSAYREPSFGHGRLELHNSTHATWTWHKNANDERVVSDNVLLVRQERGLAHHGPRHDGGKHMLVRM